MAMSAQENITPTINVNGEGTVQVIPDEVTIKVRVESQGNEAAQVKRENDMSIQSVLVFLNKEGIDKKHINTEYLNLNKNYDYNRKIYNYTANQSLSITLKDLKKYESVMSGLLNSGINRIDGVTFNSSEIKTLKLEARKNAMLDAKQRAEVYAGALGQTIGRALTISEQGASAPQPKMYAARSMAMESNDSGESIAPGELTIKVKVQVSFELK